MQYQNDKNWKLLLSFNKLLLVSCLLHWTFESARTHFPLTQPEKTQVYFITQDTGLGTLYALGERKVPHYNTDHLKFLKCPQRIARTEMFCSKKSWIWSQISLWKWKSSWTGRISWALLSLIFHQHTQQQELIISLPILKFMGNNIVIDTAV